MNKKVKCPLCRFDYRNVAAADDVCKHHQHWLVTTCEECGIVSFSNCMGICMRCGDSPDRNWFGSKDPRAGLRAIGQESSNDYFGDHRE